MDDEQPLGYSVAIDCRITRRKYYHLVVSPDGEVVFRSKMLGAVLDWLDANEIDSFTIVSDSYDRRARIQRASA